MQDGERVTVAREDEGARVAVVRKVARSFTIVVDGHFPRLESEVGAGISVHARVAAQGKLGRIPVLAHDVKRVAIFVFRVEIDEEAASKSVTDGELEVGWDPPALANGSDGPEEILELIGGVLVS